MTYAFIGGTTIGAPTDPATGITVVNLNGPDTAVIATTAADATNPMCLAASPDHRTLYATHAHNDGRVSAWTIDDDHRLTRLGSPRPSGGATPCHLAVHPSGRYLLTANYTSGTIAVHPINDDGSLAQVSHVITHHGDGPHQRQDAAHPHMIITDPVDVPGRGHVLAIDLGTDAVHRYRLDLDTGSLTETDRITLPPGAGPRHLAIHNRYAYVVGELASTLTVIELAETPTRVLSTATTHANGGAELSYPSAIRLSPDGQRAYVLNRGPNTIAVFAVEGPDVTLAATVDAGGDYPWDAILHDDHLYVAHQRTSTLTVFHLDPDTGIPKPTGTTLDIPHPVCIHPHPTTETR